MKGKLADIFSKNSYYQESDNPPIQRSENSEFKLFLTISVTVGVKSSKSINRY